MFGREASVFFARHHSLGSRQVVVHELAVGKTAADMLEEAEQLLLAERRPTGERDLKLPHAEIASALDAFNDRAERQIDDTDHRLSVSPPHFVGKGRDDFVELAICHGITFSRRAKDIELLRPMQGVLHIAAKDAFGEVTVFIPRNAAGTHDATGKRLLVMGGLVRS